MFANNSVKIVFSLFLGLLSFNFGNAQKMKDISPFQESVDQMNLELKLPKGKEFRYLKPKENEFIDYQIRIADKSREYEVLINLIPADTTEFGAMYPHLEFNRLLNNLVPNDYDQDVLVIGWREQKLMNNNADWGAEAYLKARKEITDFPFTKLISFFREDSGLVVMLFCFDKPDTVPEVLKFRGEN